MSETTDTVATDAEPPDPEGYLRRLEQIADQCVEDLEREAIQAEADAALVDTPPPVQEQDVGTAVVRPHEQNGRAEDPRRLDALEDLRRAARDLEDAVRKGDDRGRVHWSGRVQELEREVREMDEPSPPPLRPLRERLADFAAGRIRPRPPLLAARIGQDDFPVSMARAGDLIVIGGAPGVGKTQFAVGLAAALALGGTAAAVVRDDADDGRFLPIPLRDGRRVAVRVLSYEADDAEGDAPDTLGRVHRLFAARDLELPDDLPGDVPVLDVVPVLGAAADLRTEAGLRFVEEQLAPIADAGHHPVLVIDNMTAACPGMTVAEGAEMGIFLFALRRLRERFGVTIILICHTRKVGSDGDHGDPLDRIKSARELGALISQAILLDRPSATALPRQTRFICAKARGVPPFETFTTETPPDNCDFVVGTSMHADRTLAREVRDVVFMLTAHDGAQTHSTEPVPFARVATTYYRLRQEESERRAKRAKADGRRRVPKVEQVPAKPAEALRRKLDRKGYADPKSDGWREWAADFLRDCEDHAGNGRSGARTLAVRADRTGATTHHQGRLG